MRKRWALPTAALALNLSGSGYSTFQSGDEQIKANWSEVVNQYQRRADLVPNLVSTVKGEAKFEQDTLTRVIVTLRSFPSNLTAMVFGYKEKPNFSVDNEAQISRPPRVGFGNAPTRPASGAAN